MKAIQWQNGRLYLLDQTLLPGKKRLVECRSYQAAAEAIRTMKVRGAPAIGVAAAYALVLAARSYKGEERHVLEQILVEAAYELGSTRPTAVNLFWALERMKAVWEKESSLSVRHLQQRLEEEAVRIDEEDLRQNRLIGQYGSTLIPSKAAVLTHCNAGALATAGHGTALGVIRTAFRERKDIRVYAGETRPLLQGARLTAWELKEEGIEVTLITDSMAGYLMQQGKIDLVIVGADRIAANGDTANKIGTYSLAVLARYHSIPFYVAAPWTTFDTGLQDGKDIPVEMRSPEEIRRVGRKVIAPSGIEIYNPAFDITPGSLISALITDKGVIRPPYEKSIRKVRDSGAGNLPEN